MAIVLIYSDLPIFEPDGSYTLIASGIFFLLLFFFFTVIQMIEPKSDTF